MKGKNFEKQLESEKVETMTKSELKRYRSKMQNIVKKQLESDFLVIGKEIPIKIGKNPETNWKIKSLPDGKVEFALVGSEEVTFKVNLPEEDAEIELTEEKKEVAEDDEAGKKQMEKFKKKYEKKEGNKKVSDENDEAIETVDTEKGDEKQKDTILDTPEKEKAEKSELNKEIVNKEKQWLSEYLKENFDEEKIKVGMRMQVAGGNYWRISKVDGNKITLYRQNDKGQPEQNYYTYTNQKKSGKKDEKKDQAKSDKSETEIKEDKQTLMDARIEEAGNKQSFDQTMENLAEKTEVEKNLEFKIRELEKRIMQVEGEKKSLMEQKNIENQSVQEQRPDEQTQQEEVLTMDMEEIEKQAALDEKKKELLRRFGYDKQDKVIEKLEQKRKEQIIREGGAIVRQPEITVEDGTQVELEVNPEALLTDMRNNLADSLERLENHRNNAYNWYRDASFWDVMTNKASYGAAMQPVYEARHQIDIIRSEYQAKFGNIDETDKTELMLEIERMLDDYYNPGKLTEAVQAERRPGEVEDFDELFKIILSKKKPIPRDGGGQMKINHCVKMIKKFRDGKISAIALPTHDGIRETVLRLVNYRGDSVSQEIEFSETIIAKPEMSQTKISEVSIEQQEQKGSIYAEKLYVKKNIDERMKAGNQFKNGDVFIVNEGAVPGASKVEWIITEYSPDQIELKRVDANEDHYIVMDLSYLKGTETIVEPEIEPITSESETQEIFYEREKWEGKLLEAVMDTMEFSERMFRIYEKMPAFVEDSNFKNRYNDILISFGSIEGLQIEDKEFETVDQAQEFYEKTVKDEIQRILEDSVKKVERVLKAVYSKKRPVYPGEELLKEQFEIGITEIEEYLLKFSDMGINVELDNKKLDRYRLG